MGRSIHSVEGLFAPLRLIDEFLIDIPKDGELFVSNDNQSNKLLFFLEAHHDLYIDGYPKLSINSGDALIFPISASQRYHLRNGRADSKMHLLRLLFNLPTRCNRGDEPAASSQLEMDTDLRTFMIAHMDRPHHLPDAAGPEVMEIVSLIRKEADNQQPGFRFLVSSYGIQLIIAAIRRILNSDQGNNVSAPSRNDMIVARVKEYMLENYANPITLEEIAWHVRLSREHLARIFHQFTGKTVFTYLLFLRIEAAKSQLYDTNIQVNQIASHCGFSSSTQFCRNFKRIVGMTPLEYRRQRMGEVRFAPSVRKAPR